MAHVYKNGKDDYRVRVKVGKKWRDVGGVFKTREAAEKYRDSKEKR